MNFFGIGGGEVILVLIVALIIWGPKRLPEIARTLGKTMNMLKKSTYDLTSQITRELNTEDTKDKKKDIPSPPEEDHNVKPKKS